MEKINEKFKELINQKKIRYLNATDVERCGVFDFSNNIKAVAKAYEAHYNSDYVMPTLDYLKYEGRPSYDRIIVLLGYLGGDFNISGLKQINSSTSNHAHGLPRASGIIILNDPFTQRPFAIMEGAQISASRTASVTALALKHFMPEKVDKVSFIGCGYLARQHAKMWAQLYMDKCDTIHIYDINKKMMDTFKKDVEKEENLNVKFAENVEQAVRDSNIIIPLTTEEKPYIHSDWISDGSLYCAVSLLDPLLNVLKKSDHIIVDDLEFCKHEGRPLQRLEEEGLLKPEKITSMGEILTKKLDLRKDQPDSKLFFNPMGTVLTDLALAANVFENAINQNIGVELDA